MVGVSPNGEGLSHTHLSLEPNHVHCTHSDRNKRNTDDIMKRNQRQYGIFFNVIRHVVVSSFSSNLSSTREDLRSAPLYCKCV